MNVFLRELKAHRKSLIFWCLGMFAMVGSGAAKYAGYKSSGQSVNEIIAAIPKTVRIILGFGDFDVSKASGFFGLLFLYLAIMATIHAVLLGADIISKEERDKTSEFLFVKPISRAKIITDKFLASMVNLVVLNIVTFISSIVFFGNYKDEPSIVGDIALLMVAMFFLQLLFLSIGASIAAVSNKPRVASPIATSVLLVAFILSVMIDIDKNIESLKYITPFKYFDAYNLMKTGHLDYFYVALSAAIIALLAGVTYVYYGKRDLSI